MHRPSYVNVYQAPVSSNRCQDREASTHDSLASGIGFYRVSLFVSAFWTLAAQTKADAVFMLGILRYLDPAGCKKAMTMAFFQVPFQFKETEISILEYLDCMQHST